MCERDAYTLSGEIPDAIGWQHNKCFLVECKVSKSDFYADRKKPARNWNWSQTLKDAGVCYPALGHWRFYLTPPGLLKGCDLPVGWGWYEVHGKSVRYAGGEKYANAKPFPCTSDYPSERALLVSALRRVELGIE